MTTQFPGPIAQSHVARLVRADRLRLLFRQSSPALVVSLVAASLLCWVLWPVADHDALRWWLGLVFAAVVVRLALFVAYFVRRPAGLRLLSWERPYAITLLVASLVWGVGALVVMPSHDRVGQVFTFFVLIGMAGGAVSVYAAYRYMAIAAMLAVLLPAVAWAALQGGPIHTALSVGGLIFIAASVRAATELSTALHRSFALTHRLHEASDRIGASERHFRFIAEKSGDAIWTLAPSLGITYASPAVRALLGFAPEDLVDRPFTAVMTRDASRRLRDGLREKAAVAGAADGAVLRTELDLVHRDGHVVHTEAVATLQADPHGGLDTVIVVTHDISERKRDTESMRRLAFFDPLTELPNRRLLIDRLQQAIARARREGRRVGLLCVDLDDFKPVNDRFGHEAGDRLLHAVAARLKASVRQSDTAARVGGDEFIVLLSELAAGDDGSVAAAKIRAALEGPFPVPEGPALKVGSSIGVALFPDHAANEWDLLRVGDAAMYAAKRAGGNAVVHAAPAADGSDDIARDVGRGVVRLAWKDAYCCGDPDIDREHRELFAKANRLMENAATQDRAGFLRAFDALHAHVALHFDHEEAMLRARGYAGADAHAALHRRLLEQTTGLRHRADARDVTVAELADFLVSEVVGRHLLRADRAYAEALAADAAADAPGGG